MADWQPIETAPEGDVVVVFDAKAFGVSVGQMIAECWSDELNEGYPIFPTHWMPLPEPPSEPTAT